MCKEKMGMRRIGFKEYYERSIGEEKEKRELGRDQFHEAVTETSKTAERDAVFSHLPRFLISSPLPQVS